MPKRPQTSVKNPKKPEIRQGIRRWVVAYPSEDRAELTVANDDLWQSTDPEDRFLGTAAAALEWFNMHESDFLPEKREK